jgi:hypothetical protein
MVDVNIKLFEEVTAAAQALEKALSETFFQAGNNIYFGDPRRLHDTPGACKMLIASSVVTALGSPTAILNTLREETADHREMAIKMARTKFNEAVDRMRRETA